MFKWEIKIGKKPRGLWRPEVKFRVYHEKMWYVGDLNVKKEYWTEFGSACQEGRWGNCGECKKTAGVTFYKSSNPRVEGTLCPPKTIVLCEYYTAYLEWRPGKADYSDVIEKIKENILQPAIDWFQSQLQEAEASEPIEDITISSDCIASITNNKGGEKKPLPTRKVKI